MLLGMEGFRDTIDLVARDQVSFSRSGSYASIIVKSNGLSLRKISLALTILNIVAALVTIAVIYHDSGRTSRKHGKASQQRWRRLISVRIRSPDVFPLVLANAVVIQGVIFAAVQGTHLDRAVTRQCRPLSQVIWPAIWIAPYVTLVFGFEALIRFRRAVYPPRGKNNVYICIGIVLVMMLITWIPSRVSPSQRYCVANLAWLASSWRNTAIMLVVSMLVLLLSSAVGILVQLSKTVEAYPADRTAANRMVCYLTLTAVFLALTVPFFVQLSLGQRAILTSRVATFAFNMYGLLTSILYLVLRFTIAESSDSDHEPHRRSHERFRFFGSADASYVKHITSPVSATPLMTDEKATSPRECNWPLSQARKPSVRQGVAMSEPKEHVRRQRTSSWRQHIIPKRSLSVDVVKPNLPSPPKATISPVSPLTRRPSYSIFPSGTATVSRKGSVSAPQPTLDAVASLPPPLPSKAAEFVPPPLKVRIPEQYKLPPPPSFHRRNMSEASESSTTTVQIGLRLSNAPLPLDLQTPKPQPQPSKLSSTPIIGSPNSDKSLPPSPHIVEWAGLTQTRQHRLRPEIVQLGRSHTRAAKTSGKDWI